MVPFSVFSSNCGIGIGAVPAPFDCYQALRGLKTLHVRMREHEKNALAIARYLESHPKIEKVIYPGLPSHPGYEIMKKQCTGFSGMLSLHLKGNTYSYQY
jgi:cystathionine gamma-lyase